MIAQGHAQLLSTATQELKIGETVHWHNFTIYFETRENANVLRLLSAQ